MVADMVHVDLAPAWPQTVAKHLLLFLSLLAVVSSEGSYCPITVSYEVSLGQAPLATPTAGAIGDFSEIPIFFGKIGIFSNNVSCMSKPICHPYIRSTHVWSDHVQCSAGAPFIHEIALRESLS